MVILKWVNYRRKYKPTNTRLKKIEQDLEKGDASIRRQAKYMLFGNTFYLGDQNACRKTFFMLRANGRWNLYYDSIVTEGKTGSYEGATLIICVRHLCFRHKPDARAYVWPQFSTEPKLCSIRWMTTIRRGILNKMNRLPLVLIYFYVPPVSKIAAQLKFFVKAPRGNQWQ